MSVFGADLNVSLKLLAQKTIVDRNHITTLQVRRDFVYPVERGFIKNRFTNRPLDKQVGELVSETPPDGLADVPVFLGGPVGKNQLMFAAFEWQKGKGLKLNHNVGLEEASERAGQNPISICAFVGYAGWEAGQLEAEMEQKAWLLQKPSRSVLKPERLPKLWFDIMRGLGPWYKLLAAAPDDPSLN